MSTKKFEHIFVIGYGVVTGAVLKSVHELSDKWGYSFEYIEHEVHPFNLARKYAEGNNIEIHLIEDKKELLDYFRKRAIGRTLIISASNNFLFPAELTDNPDITIINFHNALLPELPGRNAPSWAIYLRKSKTGITWHYVTKGVDEGDIIIQKECTIGEDDRAFELTGRLMDLAAEAFDECFEDVLNGSAPHKAQTDISDRTLYRSTQVPGDGTFEPTDDVKDIYRLLRAMDYGKNDIFPLPVTTYEDKKIRIKRYKKIKKEEIVEKSNRIYLPMDADNALMLKYEEITQ